MEEDELGLKEIVTSNYDNERVKRILWSLEYPLIEERVVRHDSFDESRAISSDENTFPLLCTLCTAAKKIILVVAGILASPS